MLVKIVKRACSIHPSAPDISSGTFILKKGITEISLNNDDRFLFYIFNTKT